jgi:hypothetical protein
MTSSRSKASTSRLLAAAVALVCALGATAIAGGRKRVVVLDFEGPHADKFHDDVVRILKKTHTVVPVDKWNGAAEDLGAAKATDKDIKKVAKKLKIDGIVSGKIEKRRDEYIIRLKLREGKSGAAVGGAIDTKAEGPRVDGKAQEDIKGELVDAIDGLAMNRGGDDDDEDEKPAKRPPPKKDKADDTADDEDEKPAKRPPPKKDRADDADDADEKPKKAFSKRDDDKVGGDKVGKKDKADDADDEDERPAKKPPKKVAKKDSDDEADEDEAPKHKKAKKKVARGDDDESVEAGSDDGDAMDKAVALSPAQRAVDAIVGVSFTARRLSFSSQSDLVSKPPGYKGNPVPGGMLDATIYPLAFGHKRTDLLKNVGLTLMYDRVISLKSKDPASGMTLPTTESRYAFGAVFRYPFGSGERQPVVGAALTYGSQSFTISGTPDIPNVKYTIIEPTLTFRYPATAKIILNVDAGLLLFTNTGDIQQKTSYGSATVTGFEGTVGADYLITANIFARVAVKYESIGFKFKGTGTQSTGRDGDPEQDVFGAKDNYIGGFATVGYAY